MFKSKTDFNAFDKKNEKVKNLEASAVKNLSKQGVKKLLNSAGEKTNYYLILDYFVDTKGKPVGHFLDLGINKKMAKHFEQVEMKTGKMDKSMSDSPKKACTGEVYVRKTAAKTLVYFVPNGNSKIPKGQWPKILKSLKPLLGGLKALAVIGGELVTEEKGTDEGKTSSEKQESKPQKDKEPSASEKLVVLIKKITDGIKVRIPKDVVPNIKAKKTTKEDTEIIVGLINAVAELKSSYNNTSTAIKEKYAKHYNAILNQEATLTKLKQKVEGLLTKTDSTTETVETESEEEKTLRELLKHVENEMKAFEAKFSKIESEITQSESIPIVGGDELLSALYA